MFKLMYKMRNKSNWEDMGSFELKFQAEYMEFMIKQDPDVVETKIVKEA